MLTASAIGKAEEHIGEVSPHCLKLDEEGCTGGSDEPPRSCSVPEKKGTLVQRKERKHQPKKHICNVKLHFY